MRAESAGVADELDLGAVGRALMRKKIWVIGPTLLVATLSVAAVNVMTPRYKSEARVLVEGRENVFLPPEAEKTAEPDRRVDPQAVASQVQLVFSRDLALKVIKELKLGERAEFDSVLRGGSLKRQLLGVTGLACEPLKMSSDERVLEAYYERLTAFPVETSRVIAIEFWSADPQLAAVAATAIAESYLELQQSAQQDQTRAVAGEQDVPMRALEREAKVQRDLLESDLAKSREANARAQLGTTSA